MGWFSSDEIITAPAAANSNVENHTAQTIALCALAVATIGYLIVKGVTKLHRQNTVRLAEQAARRVAAQVWIEEIRTSVVKTKKKKKNRLQTLLTVKWFSQRRECAKNESGPIKKKVGDNEVCVVRSCATREEKISKAGNGETLRRANTGRDSWNQIGEYR